MKNLMLTVLGLCFLSATVMAAPQVKKNPEKKGCCGEKKEAKKSPEKKGCCGEKKEATKKKRRAKRGRRPSRRTFIRGYSAKMRGRTHSSRYAFRAVPSQKNSKVRIFRCSRTPNKRVEVSSERAKAIKKLLQGMRAGREEGSMSEKGRRMPSKKRGGKRGGRPLVAPANAHRRYNSTRS